MNPEFRLDEVTVRDNEEEGRYEARIGGDVIGAILYQEQPGRLTLIHTEVDSAVEGKGVASRLIAGTLEDVRRRGLAIVPVCPFVRSYLRRHPEQADLVVAR
jgi:uncharacterized protein